MHNEVSRLRCKPEEILFQFFIKSPHHVEGQRQDIFRSLTQRRNKERHDVESIEEILCPWATAPLRFVLVAVTRRMSTLIGLVPPRRRKVSSSNTRKSLACTLGDMFPISSRKSVPACARSSRPSLRRHASVKAPGSNPNSCSLRLFLASFAVKRSRRQGPKVLAKNAKNIVRPESLPERCPYNQFLDIL
jgi:hypothetical protein